MSDESTFLKYLIHEEIYLIEGDSEPAKVEAIATQQLTDEPAELEQVEESLVEEPEVVTEVKPQEPTRKILVVFDSANGQMETAQQAYLGKILSAVKLSLNDVQLLPSTQVAQLNTAACEKIISFSKQYTAGASAPYKLTSQGSQEVLCVDDLTTIAASVELRKSLWEGLKAMFGV